MNSEYTMAAAMAGIIARTIRRWVVAGKSGMGLANLLARVEN